MSELKLNGQSVGAVEIRQLWPDISAEDAKQMLGRDGLDEVIFADGDQLYVAYGKKLNLSQVKWEPAVLGQVDGRPVQVKGIDDEANGAIDGMKRALRKPLALLGIGSAAGMAAAESLPVLGLAGSPAIAAIGLIGIGAAGVLALKGALTAREPDESLVYRITRL